jgi:hypothetical protein
LSDLDVTFITPRWSPRVLDKEVVGTVFGSVTNSEDTVVESGTASGSSDNTTGVTLEGHLVSLDGNRDGLLGNGSLQSGTGFVSGDIVEGFDGDSTSLFHGLVASAGDTLSRGIRIGLLSNHRGLLSILESVVHETTIATGVDGGALDELLLREGDEAAGGKEVSTFEGTGGGESPA